MLRSIGNHPLMVNEAPRLEHEQSKYHRNECEDLKKAIEYLYEFKEKLSKLHPSVLDSMEHMLQRPRY